MVSVRFSWRQRFGHCGGHTGVPGISGGTYRWRTTYHLLTLNDPVTGVAPVLATMR